MSIAKTLTMSGNEITDAVRAAGVEGDGLPIGSGVGIWPAATNLVTNGGFETNTAGWIAVSSGETVTRDTTVFKFGTASGRVSTPGSTAFEGMQYATTTTAAATYTGSCWVRAPEGATMRIRLRQTSAPATVIATTEFVGTGDWQHVSVTGAAIDTSTNVQVITNLSAQEITYYIDGVQVESGSIATPYIETDGSTESRTAGRVQMPVADLFTETQGWIAMRMLMPYASTDGASGTGRYFAWETTDNFIRAFRSAGATPLAVQRQAAGVGNPVTKTGAWTAGDAISAVATWTAAGAGASLDGSTFSTVAQTAIPDLSGLSTVDFGRQSGGSNVIDANYLWVATGSGTLTDADAAALNALGATPPTWAQLVSSVAICAMPTALWRAEDDTFIKASYAPDGGS